MYFEKPMNIQLFADEQGAEASTTTTATTTGISANAPQQQTQQQTTNTVSKELYDRTASEVAELKRQLKELQKTGKSEAELKELDIKEKDAELQKRNEELHKLYVELNRANAKSILAETQAKFNLKDPNMFDKVIDAIVVDNGEITKERANNLNNLLKAVYDKAISDVKTNQWSEMTKDVKSGESQKNTNKEMQDFIKSLRPDDSEQIQKIKDAYKAK